MLNIKSFIPARLDFKPHFAAFMLQLFAVASKPSRYLKGRVGTVLMAQVIDESQAHFFGPSVLDQVLNASWQSFKTEFEPFEAEIRQCSKNVNKEISLAKAQADHQDQQLQLREREAASKGRKAWNEFMTKSGKENEKFREWRLQVEDRKASKYHHRSRQG